MIEHTCNKCEKVFRVRKKEELAKNFPRDRSKDIGFRNACKTCQKNYRDNNRELINDAYNRNYEKNETYREKAKIRLATRRKYGSASDKKCNRCPSDAADWHHLKYHVDGAIAVCKPCHVKIHDEENK